MIIVLLIGKSNCGKTTTCKQLYQELISEHAKIQKTTYKENGGDFSCVLNYKEKIIAIKSAGDSRNRVREALKKQCDILICACRCTFGDMIDLAKQKTNAVFSIDKEKESDKSAIDRIIDIIK